MYEKLILLTTEQKEKLESIKRNVKNNGGSVSANQLIRDSLHIFLESYQKTAIKKYSPYYELEEESWIMKTLNGYKYDKLNLLVLLDAIDPEEYFDYLDDLEPKEPDLNDFEPDWDGEPRQEQDLPKDYDKPDDRLDDEPKEPLNDFKPEDISRYKREYLGKNWQNTKYYY